MFTVTGNNAAGYGTTPQLFVRPDYLQNRRRVRNSPVLPPYFPAQSPIPIVEEIADDILWQLHSMSFEIGEITGDYEIVSVLGSGGMGKVYKVRNTYSDRFDAMKVLLPDLTNSSELADRFLREIKVQARLNHPNIASLHTALRVNNQLLMIMELVEGNNLEQEIRRGPIGLRPQERSSPSRHQAREHHPDAIRAGEADGFRHCPRRRRPQPHQNRNCAGLTFLHVPRSDSRGEAGREIGHLLAGRYIL